MHTFEPVQVGDHFSLLRIEDDQLVCIHVGCIEPTVYRIEALVVESNRRSGHGNVDDRLEGIATRVGTASLSTRGHSAE